MNLKLVVFGVVSILFFSCANTKDERVQIVDLTPVNLLQTIVALDENWQYQDMKQLIYGVSLGGNENSGENILRGIMGRTKGGPFSYSQKAFTNLATLKTEEIRNLTTEELTKYFFQGGPLGSDVVLKKIATEDPTGSLKIFFKEYAEGLSATLIFVQIEGHWKLLYSNEITLLEDTSK